MQYHIEIKRTRWTLLASDWSVFLQWVGLRPASAVLDQEAKTNRHQTIESTSVCSVVLCLPKWKRDRYLRLLALERMCIRDDPGPGRGRHQFQLNRHQFHHQPGAISGARKRLSSRAVYWHAGRILCQIACTYFINSSASLVRLAALEGAFRPSLSFGTQVISCELPRVPLFRSTAGSLGQAGCLPIAAFVNAVPAYSMCAVIYIKRRSLQRTALLLSGRFERG
jgi:hypothetical protein